MKRAERVSALVAAVLAVLVIASACSSTPSVVTGDPLPTTMQAAVTPVAPPDGPTQQPAPASTPDVMPTATPAISVAPTVPAEPDESGEPADCREPEPDQAYRLEVVDVAPNDRDGGLVVHAEPGASTPAIDVLPWDASGIHYTYASCTVVDDGGTWWNIGAGETIGWVNARYLGDRTVAADAFDVTPCVTTSQPVPPVEATSVRNERVAITDFDVTSSQDCDRVVITLGQDWNFRSSTSRSIDRFPPKFVKEARLDPTEFELTFTSDVMSAVDSVWFSESWRDAATNEENVVLAFDRDDRISAYVGWGTGTAAVRYLDNPARIVIDIAQAPTEPGRIAGPIVGAATLFDPIQTDLWSPGVELPITVRGYSRGFEANSVFHLAPWDQTSASHPFEWNGDLFGLPPHQQFEGEISFEGAVGPFGAQPPFPFTTSGYFEFEITDLAPGAYQLAIEPSNGCGGTTATGQQFRVLDVGAPTGDAAVPKAATFSLQLEDRGSPDSMLVTTVLGEEQRAPADTLDC